MPYNAQTTAEDVMAGADLAGRTAVVTGGTSGIGEVTARALAAAGAHVVLTGRNATRGGAAAARVREASGSAEVDFAPLDLASLRSVSAFAADYRATGRPLHLLIANAGVMATPLSRTAEGFELQFGTNHLGHFALTRGLLPALRAASGARVVVLSSRGHRRSDIHFEDPNYLERAYDPWEAYGQSKTANALFAAGLAPRGEADGITANAVMPGAISTGLQAHLPPEQLTGALGYRTDPATGAPVPPPGWKTPEQGAATTLWAAVSPELAGVSGHYLEDCAVAAPWTGPGGPPNGHYLPYALDPERAERLWQLSEKLTEG